MSDDLTERLREASVPLTLEMAMEGYVQDAHAVALHAEAADRIEQLEVERDELHDDVLTALRVRNAALTRAAAHFHPGPDAADDTIRQSLIEEWVTDGHEQVAEENRQRTQMLVRMIAAEQERDEARAENTKLREALRRMVAAHENGPRPNSVSEQVAARAHARLLLADIEEADDA